MVFDRSPSAGRRGGRPPLRPEQRRATKITLRVTPEEAQRLQRLAAAAKVEVGTWVRQAALQRRVPPPPPSQDVRVFYAALAPISHRVEEGLLLRDTAQQAARHRVLTEALGLIAGLRLRLVGVSDRGCPDDPESLRTRSADTNLSAFELDTVRVAPCEDPRGGARSPATSERERR